MTCSLPTPFYDDRPPDHERLQAAIRAGLERLAATGVAFIAMPCNTAHIYHARVSASIPVPLLSMVSQAVTLVDATHCLARRTVREWRERVHGIMDKKDGHRCGG